jgi:hypothetical protein
VYKVNGSYWAVSFDSTLGDVPALVAAPSKYLSDGTDLLVYDGSAPLSADPARPGLPGDWGTVPGRMPSYTS